MGSTGKDERGRARAERNYYAAGGALKRCVVCHRLFTRRQSDTCSLECEKKAKPPSANQ
jgi:hypothetical protein